LAGGGLDEECTIFRVVPSEFSTDTVEAAAQLHGQATTSKAIGTAMVVMYKAGVFITAFVGECHRSPVWSIRAVDMLKARIRRPAEYGGC
jgi:hypothetical protein